MAFQVKQCRSWNRRNIAILLHKRSLLSTPTLASLHRAIPNAIGGFHTSDLASLPVDLDERVPLPLGWQKVLNLKTGQIYYKEEAAAATTMKKMSRIEKKPKIDLRLNLSPPQADSQTIMSPNRSRSSLSSSTSSASSCLSSELNMGTDGDDEATTSMNLLACPNCFIFVMKSEGKPKCPKCMTTILVDFFKDGNTTTNPTKKSRKN